MSWNTSAVITGDSVDDEIDALHKAQAAVIQSWDNHSDDTKLASLEQLEVAIDAAQGLILSGLVGDPAGKRFNVSLSGHVNPNHEPAEGWANDYISISVSQAT